MLTIEINDREIRTALEKLAGRVADLSPVMRGIGADMERRMLERFETETCPAGRRWAPLSKRTLKAKKNRGSILYHFGSLQESRTSSADSKSVRWGFGQKYAAFHEFGTKKMPRRGLLLADAEGMEPAEEDRRLILEAIRAHLEDAL